jgi:hypothetical protein
VPPFVAILVKLRPEFPVRFWRYDGLNPRSLQISTQPIGIKRSVCKEHFACNTFDQLCCFAQIVGLIRHQAKADEVTKRIRQRQNFGGNSPARLPYSLLPNSCGRSRQAAPGRAIHKTAFIKRRLLPPVRPGSRFLPKQWGSIKTHWASLITKRSLNIQTSLLERRESELSSNEKPESQ